MCKLGLIQSIYYIWSSPWLMLLGYQVCSIAKRIAVAWNFPPNSISRNLSSKVVCPWTPTHTWSVLYINCQTFKLLYSVVWHVYFVSLNLILCQIRNFFWLFTVLYINICRVMFHLMAVVIDLVKYVYYNTGEVSKMYKWLLL